MAEVPSRTTTGRRKLVTILLAVLMASTSVVAHAVVTTFFDKPFHNNSSGGGGTVVKPGTPPGVGTTNMACLTATGNPLGGGLRSCSTFTDPQGEGKLRLTDATTSKVGGAFSSTASSSFSMTVNKGMRATFNLYQYGGTNGEGMTFALAAADPVLSVAPTTIGQGGSALGYSRRSSNGLVGMPNAYLGFGFDTYGGFSSTDQQEPTCAAKPYIGGAGARVPGQVVVRGPGSGATGYCAINSTAANTSSPALPLRAATREASAVPVEVVLNPTSSTMVTTSGLTVPAGQYLLEVTLVGGAVRTLSGTLPTVPAGLYPANWVSANGLPKQLTFGWTGATASLHDFHEVDEARVSTLDPAATLTVTQTSHVAAAPQPGDPVTFHITPAVAAGVDVTAPVTVTQTLPAGVVPLGAFGTGWVCQPPSGQTITCTNSNAPFTAGTSLPAITVVAIVTGVGVTPASVQSGTSVTASASEAVTGSASSATAGTVGPTPAGVTASPDLGPTAGGNAVTISGTNITTANAIEIGTAAEFQAGTPTVLLPCPAGPAAGCFTVSGDTLQISAMPAHTTADVQVKVVTDGVAGTGTYTYRDPLALTFGPLPTATAGVAYTVTLTATGGVAPYTWSVTAGTLPAGLQLDGTSGTISGTPILTGTSSFTVQVADVDDRTVTQQTSITVNPGLLSIAADASADLGTTASGSATLSADLGSVTVTDYRGDPSVTWVATVSTTTFTTGGGGTGQTVPADRIAYDTGTWESSGTGTFVPASLPNGALPGVGASWNNGVGANTVTWHPSLTFTFVPQQVAGQYAGVITHSVA